MSLTDELFKQIDKGLEVENFVLKNGRIIEVDSLDFIEYDSLEHILTFQLKEHKKAKLKIIIKSNAIVGYSLIEKV